ncbi:MAG: hypothetical protein AAFN81_31575, partial [Bacteroidota bacterium]
KNTRRLFGRHSPEAQTALEEYHQLNHIFRNYSRFEQAKYEQELINKISEAPKLFHGYLRERKKGCPSVGPLKDEEGNLVQSSLGMSLLVHFHLSMFPLFLLALTLINNPTLG